MNDASPTPDGDAICRAVFVAGARLGRPDAFLARELTDAALHFLAESDDDPNDVIERVVRELGHPDLALALPRTVVEPPLALASPAEPMSALERMRLVAGEANRTLARRDVYSADLVAAADAGLIHFLDADTPAELAGGVIAVGDPTAAFDAVIAARERYGQFIAVDGPEFALSNGRAAAVWARGLRSGLLATGLRAVVNLNPPDRDDTTMPLFPGEPNDRDARLDDLRQTLVTHLLWEGNNSVRIDWHLSERDFQPDGRLRLLRLCRRALAGESVAFAFDRGRNVPLAEGIDRRWPELLCAVAVDLQRLAAHLGEPGTELLHRLPSLARLAAAAGRARRAYLRRLGRPELSEEFRLDRAKVAVVPIGLTTLAGYATDDAAVETALAVLRALRIGLDASSRLDSPPGRTDDPTQGVMDFGEGSPRQRVLRTARLHAEIEAGTCVVEFPEAARLADDLAHLLWVAARTAGLVRLRVRRQRIAQPSLGADW